MDEFKLSLKKYNNSNICDWAAKNGRLDVLQLAREQGCPWSDWTCTLAAKNGHLHILQWAREHGCPWDALTCSYAAENGHLHILRWAHEHGCPWDVYVCLYAAWGGYLHILQWALEHKCPIESYTEVGFKNRHFTSASKLLHRNIFEKQDKVERWIKTVDEACNTLTYNDLSKLIKSFI